MSYWYQTNDMVISYHTCNSHAGISYRYHIIQTWYSTDTLSYDNVVVSKIYHTDIIPDNNWNHDLLICDITLICYHYWYHVILINWIITCHKDIKSYWCHSDIITYSSYYTYISYWYHIILISYRCHIIQISYHIDNISCDTFIV